MNAKLVRSLAKDLARRDQRQWQYLDAMDRDDYLVAAAVLLDRLRADIQTDAPDVDQPLLMWIMGDGGE